MPKQVKILGFPYSLQPKSLQSASYGMLPKPNLIRPIRAIRGSDDYSFAVFRLLTAHRAVLHMRVDVGASRCADLPGTEKQGSEGRAADAVFGAPVNVREPKKRTRT